MKPILVHLRFARPCLESRLKDRICSEMDIKQMDNAILSNEDFPVDRIKELFPFSYSGLERLAKKLHKGVWSREVIEEYWFREHNKVIDRGEGPYEGLGKTVREHCKTYLAVVKENKGEYLLVQGRGHNPEIVFSILVPDAKKGDKIWVHQSYGVLKIE